MNIHRGRWHALTLATALLAMACGGDESADNETDTPSQGGSGGSAGKGGSSGKGGSAGTGDSAGKDGGSGQGGGGASAGGSGGAGGASAGAAGTVSGSSGQGGAAGSATAGSGGNAAGSGGEGATSGAAGAGAAGASGGSAGAGGSGGSAAGAGGSGGSAAGAGGSGGSGQSGSGGASGSAGCQPACEAGQQCSAAGSCIEPGTCLVNQDCGDGLVCNAGTKKCEPGSECGVTKVTAQAVAPNILIVLDRSCSMKQKTGNQTKWEAAADALTTLTETFKSEIRFGMSMFPDVEGNECTQNGSSVIAVGPNAYTTIQTRLANSQNPNNKFYPDGPCVTNIDTAMEEASKQPALADPARASFVLLISDGAQAGCNAGGGNAGVQKFISEMKAKGIGTFVVGFAGNVSEANLNKFAQLGGFPNPDPALDYYKAENAASLKAALNVIAKQTLGCTLALEQPPPDPNDLFVFFDKSTQVAQDKTHQSGWDYDPAQKVLTFYGDTCKSLQGGSIGQVDVVYGCPGTGDEVLVPPGCESNRGCDATHLCPVDPKEGQGFCQTGCCVYGKFLPARALGGR